MGQIREDIDRQGDRTDRSIQTNHSVTPGRAAKVQTDRHREKESTESRGKERKARKREKEKVRKRGKKEGR